MQHPAETSNIMQTIVYAECDIFDFVMLSFIMLNVVMPKILLQLSFQVAFLRLSFRLNYCSKFHSILNCSNTAVIINLIL